MTALTVLALLLGIGLQGISDVHGVIYHRWGRTVCPYGAVKLYAGFMGSKHYNHNGSGGNYLCMHNQPQSSDRLRPLTANFDTAGAIYGVEYEFYLAADKPFSFANNGGQSLAQNNAPCVVCYRPDRIDQLMVPGRFDCGGTDMNVEYTGFIVSQFYNHLGQTEFICFDEAPEVIYGGGADENQGVIYPAKIDQGSLPIPPYERFSDVPCAVCTI